MQVSRSNLVKIAKNEIEDCPEISEVLWSIQSGTYVPKIPEPTKLLLPEEYPLAINEESKRLTPQKQGIINRIVTSKKDNWLSEEDISDSYYRDTLIRKAIVISKSRSMDVEEMFMKKNYQYQLKRDYQDILLYSPIIITNNDLQVPVPEKENTFIQARADFLCQYRKVLRMMEGFESYRKEIIFFEKEPEYFERVVEKTKAIRKELVSDSKQKRQIKKDLANLDVEIGELKKKHETTLQQAKKIGKFILNSKIRQEIKEMEARVFQLQQNLIALNEQLEDVETQKSFKTTNLREMQEERRQHTQAREELENLITKGLVIPTKNSEIAPWNNDEFNDARHKLFDCAIILIDAFEKECKDKKINIKWNQGIMTYEQFITKYHRYKPKELGTVIISKSISTAQGLLCGYYGKRSLQITDLDVIIVSRGEENEIYRV